MQKSEKRKKREGKSDRCVKRADFTPAAVKCRFFRCRGTRSLRSHALARSSSALGNVSHTFAVGDNHFPVFACSPHSSAGKSRSSTTTRRPETKASKT